MHRFGNKLREALKPGGKVGARPIDVLSGYARWADSYPARSHNPLMKLEEQAVHSLLPNVSGRVCLDLACGSGRYLRMLRARGAAQVFGLDFSAEMLAQAIMSLAAPSLIGGNMQRLPFAAQTIGLIACGLAVGHVADLDQVVAEMGRVLQTGGSVVYSDFHPCGTLLGWERSFTASDGTRYALEHHLHLYADHHRACVAAGLTIDAVLEPLAGAAVPAQFRHVPAVLVIRAVKAS
jgi:malonyl-CoA O-methyltransferase